MDDMNMLAEYCAFQGDITGPVFSASDVTRGQWLCYDTVLVGYPYCLFEGDNLLARPDALAIALETIHGASRYAILRTLVPRRTYQEYYNQKLIDLAVVHHASGVEVSDLGLVTYLQTRHPTVPIWLSPLCAPFSPDQLSMPPYVFAERHVLPTELREAEILAFLRSCPQLIDLHLFGRIVLGVLARCRGTQDCAVCDWSPEVLPLKRTCQGCDIVEYRSGLYSAAWYSTADRLDIFQRAGCRHFRFDGAPGDETVLSQAATILRHDGICGLKECASALRTCNGYLDGLSGHGFYACNSEQ